MKQTIEIIWFKRDLRTFDHQPLLNAYKNAYKHALNNALNKQSPKSNNESSQQIGLLPIYIMDPEIWQNSQASARHWRFIYESLLDLQKQLAEINLSLQVFQGSAVDVFACLMDEFSINNVHSHQETGHMDSFKRDLAVKKLLNQQQITWLETPQQAVKRGNLNRDHYANLSNQFFNSAPLPSPITLLDAKTASFSFKVISQSAGDIKEFEKNPYLELQPNINIFKDEQTQKGGRRQAMQLLDSFLNHRHKKYLANISKPLGGDLFSSRLSAHLAYGTISTKEVMFYAQQAVKQGKQINTPIKNESEMVFHDEEMSSSKSNFDYYRGIRVFQQRLFWQSHFMQKLETEPEIEFHCMHSAYEDIRAWDEHAQTRYHAWSQGQTGFPMIDACMRCLQQTGWLPFRMRALLVSFASYQLWIPWQKTAQHLARMFTDFEPGIHYSQVQMQSGTTGINAIRIYNPIKQSQEHDANGAFIRKWCPELKQLDKVQIHTPWQSDLMVDYENLDYPKPIIDLEIATQQAKDIVYGIKKQLENKVISQAVFIKHGSRNSPERRVKKSQTNNRKKTKNKIDERQLSLF